MRGGGGGEAVVQRCSEAVEEFRWPVMRAMGSCSMRGPWRMRGGRWRRATMAEGGSSLKGAVGGGIGFTSGGVGDVPVTDDG
jgi:hypothetical protein